MNRIDNLLEGFASEITKQPTITIKDGNNDKRYFTFDIEKIKHLEKELKKHYGDKIVAAISKEIKKAIEGNYLKQFANDRSVDFIIKDGQLQSVFKQSSSSVETDEEPSEEIVTEELAAEFTGGLNSVKIYGGDKTWIGTIPLSDLLKGSLNKFIYNPKLGPNNEKPLPVHLSALKNILLKDADNYKGTDGNYDFIFSGGKIIKMTPD